MKPSAPLMLCCAMVLSGCAAFAPQTPIAAVPPATDPAVKLLTEAAARAERALSALALALPTPPPATALPPLNLVPAALQRTVTLDWIGPLETLAEDLARRADYRFLAAGPAPVRPLIVAIEADSVPLIAVMRDAGLQANAAATLVVDAEFANGAARLGSAATHLLTGAGRMTGFSIRLILALGLAGFFCSAAAARASDPPPDLNAIQDLVPAVRSSTPFAEEKRHAAMRLAALGFGSRAGLARRGWEIAGLLDRHAARLSGIYRFRDLMLNESGFAVLPPAVAETRDAFRLGRGQAQAATAKRVLRIVEPARIVGAPPGWRDYLSRPGPRPWCPPPCCSRVTRTRPCSGGAGSPRAGRKAPRSPTISSPPISTASTGPSRASCDGTGCTGRAWSRRPALRPLMQVSPGTNG